MPPHRPRTTIPRSWAFSLLVFAPCLFPAAHAAHALPSHLPRVHPAPFPASSSPRMVASAVEAPPRYSVALVALGCPKNTVDAEVMLGDLQRRGLRISSHARDADVIIVNTCAFVEDAKRESIRAVVEAAELKGRRDAPPRALFVTGCLAQRYAEELAAELPEVDAVIGFENYAEIPDKVLAVLQRVGGPAAPYVSVGSASVPFRAEDERWSLTPKHSAYIRVAEGCDHSCSFCAIPGFRGSFRSKPFDVLLAEARRLVEGGVRELNLIAEDTNQYGSDWGEADARRLPQLLRELCALPELRWVRLLYCYPSYFSEELIDTIANEEKVVKYIDIPLQHLAPTTLVRMRRPSAASTTALIEKLKARIPQLVLRTTFICGFPGETEAEHQELVRKVEQLGFERGGAFAYSQEEGTPAAAFDDQVEEEVKQDRRDALVSLFQDHGRAWANAQVGKELRVIIDSMEGLDAVGRSEYDAPEIDNLVRIPSMPLAPGTVIRARIVAVDDMDLIGEAVMG